MGIIYKCDLCGKTIDDPFRQKMKEFYIDGLNFWRFTKIKKIDLCNDCFLNLKNINISCQMKAINEKQ